MKDNYKAKGLYQKSKRRSLLLYLLFLLYVVSSALALIIMKQGTEALGLTFTKHIIEFQAGTKLLFGIALYIFSFLLSIYLIKQFSVSYMYPIASGIINVIVCVLSILVLKEEISIIKWLGVLMIAGGVILMNLKPR